MTQHPDLAERLARRLIELAPKPGLTWDEHVPFAQALFLDQARGCLSALASLPDVRLLNIYGTDLLTSYRKPEEPKP